MLPVVLQPPPWAALSPEPGVPGLQFGCFLASMPEKVRWRFCAGDDGPSVRKDVQVTRQAAVHSAHVWRHPTVEEKHDVPDDTLATALVLEFGGRTLPWHSLTPDQECQLKFWIHVAGNTQLQMMFFRVRHSAMLDAMIPVNQFGGLATRVPRSFAFSLEAGQAQHLMNDVGEQMPSWFSSVSEAIRLPAPFVELISTKWDWLGLPIFNVPGLPDGDKKAAPKWLGAEFTVPRSL